MASDGPLVTQERPAGSWHGSVVKSSPLGQQGKQFHCGVGAEPIDRIGRSNCPVRPRLMVATGHIRGEPGGSTAMDPAPPHRHTEGPVHSRSITSPERRTVALTELRRLIAHAKLTDPLRSEVVRWFRWSLDGCWSERGPARPVRPRRPPSCGTSRPSRLPVRFARGPCRQNYRLPASAQRPANPLPGQDPHGLDAVPPGQLLALLPAAGRVADRDLVGSHPGAQ